VFQALSVLAVPFGHDSRPGFAAPFTEYSFGWVETWSLVLRPGRDLSPTNQSVDGSIHTRSS
jgi:hypothetical protein